MPMFKKKPVKIEAHQHKGSPQREIDLLAWIGDSAHIEHDGGESTNIIIHTLEGDHTANIGDWIIKGVAGEFYPCKPDIFEQTYELVKE